jgi:hypothetical protein
MIEQVSHLMTIWMGYNSNTLVSSWNWSMTQLVIFHLDQVLIWQAKRFVDKWFLIEQLRVLFWVQHVLNVV